ncbi:glycosyltransferase family 4 protein [Crocosphaera chwakensis]|uniref:Glycosyl transferase, group 1 n=1 Tax=Crocosphaera chwakensis CCY0110 TaxID=391612 RepID=A3IR91_9CHRO|nr:glycosyltransferase family 4 protein [Crocosphaera chwakensis]EAZ91081.1 Glycosyl transferase, group 1 [Crocosphaera chwakensis CCY0110]
MTISKSNKQLNISLIVSDLSSKGAGRWGGAIRPFLLAQALQKLGHTVKIFGIAYEENGLSELPQDLPIISIPCPYYAGFGGTWRSLKQLLPKIDGDILYAVKLKPSSYGIALLKKYLSHRPLIVDIDDWEMSWFGGDGWRYNFTVKGFIEDLFKGNAPLQHPDHPFYLQRIEKLVSLADQVTLHTQFIQQRFGGIYVPNGKDTDLFDPQKYDPQKSRQKYNLENYKILMFPGAPRPYKGVEDILIALEKLNNPEFKLVIVGGSPYDNYDKKLEETWGKWLIQLPKSPVDAMPEIVSAAHLVVVPQQDTPATKAQFPLKLTDGMAMAKPILASKVGDIPEILGDTGYLVDPSCPDQLATQIDWIFNHLEEAQAKGKQARKRCIKTYSLQSMATILSQILEPFCF